MKYLAVMFIVAVVCVSVVGIALVLSGHVDLAWQLFKGAALVGGTLLLVAVLSGYEIPRE